MQDSREVRLHLAVKQALAAIMETCSEEGFLSHFQSFKGLEDQSKLLNLREMFVQLLESSIVQEIDLIAKNLDLSTKLAELDCATRTDMIVGLKTVDPKLVVAKMRCNAKRAIRDELVEAKKDQEKSMDETRQRYEAAAGRVKDAVTLLSKAEAHLSGSDAAVDSRVHGARSLRV